MGYIHLDVRKLYRTGRDQWEAIRTGNGQFVRTEAGDRETVVYSNLTQSRIFSPYNSTTEPMYVHGSLGITQYITFCVKYLSKLQVSYNR